MHCRAISRGRAPAASQTTLIEIMVQAVLDFLDLMIRFSRWQEWKV